MHEMALCESILQILEEESGKQGYSRVKAVRLEIGALSCVEKEALRFNFEVITQGSLAEGASLELLDVPGQAWCMPCGQAVEMGSLVDPCPLCGGFQVQVTGGEELQIRDLEVV